LKHLKITFATILLICVAAACAKNEARRATPVQPAAQKQTLEKQFEEIASLAKGHVGVMAVVLENNQSASLNPRDHFPMQSVYKLPISMAVLKQIDDGKLKLDQKVRVTKADFIGPNAHSPIRDKNPNGVELTIRELIRYAIVESDGTASDVLMRLGGGPGAMQSYLKELNISDIIVLNSEMELQRDWQVQYRNWATPEAAVALLRALQEHRALLSEASEAVVMKDLIESTPGAKRLKALLPAGTVIAHKTGTSGSRNGVTAATNDIGIISLPNGRHLAIAVFVSDSPTDEATRESTIAKIAKAAFEEFR
jgi:beta-lactamase class A